MDRKAEETGPVRPLRGWSGRETRDGIRWQPARQARLGDGSFSSNWGDLSKEGRLTAHSTDGETFLGRWDWKGREGIAEFVLYRNSKGVAFVGRWMDGKSRQGRWFFVLDFEDA